MVADDMDGTDEVDEDGETDGDARGEEVLDTALCCCILPVMRDWPRLGSNGCIVMGDEPEGGDVSEWPIG